MDVLGPFWVGLILASIFAATMSTADSQVSGAPLQLPMIYSLSGQQITRKPRSRLWLWHSLQRAYR